MKCIGFVFLVLIFSNVAYAQRPAVVEPEAEDWETKDYPELGLAEWHAKLARPDVLQMSLNLAGR